MLISYPILPAPAASSSEAELEAFIKAHVDTTKGLYPVSAHDRWHGGIHLKPGAAPIRAIADGEVVAYRVITVPETYKKQDFDTSFVLLKHTTETGENTPVVFYSLYMHLANRRDLQQNQRIKQLPDWLQKAAPGTQAQAGSGQKVWRKDILGFGGQLYGDRQVHFEIFTPDISGFWKDSKSMAQGANGSPDFFGDAQFVVPSGTHFLATHPDAKKHRDQKLYTGNQVEPTGEDGVSGGELSIITPAPIDSFLAGVGTVCANTDGRLFVQITFDKGKRTATSYQLDANGDVQSIGAPIVQDDYEYNLYSIASALYPDCPSAGFEYLRFGRVLGPDTTTQQHNWQFVRYGKDPDAVGYVDLAASNVTKLSDADFPFWQGWQTIDEGSDVVKEDGICDVPAVQRLLNIPTDKQGQSLLNPPDLAARIKDPAVAKKLRHLICKFNSEWDASDIDMRYKRWYQPGQRLQDPASQKDFKDHVKKMAFWPTTGLARSVWHFHPLQFIAQYRKCGWLSKNELSRALKAAPVAGQARADGLRLPMNQMFDKYVVSQSRLRMAHFLAQVGHETGWWRYREEIGNERYFRTMYEIITPAEAGEDYDRAVTLQRNLPSGRRPAGIPNPQHKRTIDRAAYISTRPGQVARKAAGMDNGIANHAHGGETGDGARFHGRGFLQITGRRNYTHYGAYRGNNFTVDPKPTFLGTNGYNACDASGYYWSRESINKQADHGPASIDVKQVGSIINLGHTGGTPNHNLERESAFNSIWSYLNDAP